MLYIHVPSEQLLTGDWWADVTNVTSTQVSLATCTHTCLDPTLVSTFSSGCVVSGKMGKQERKLSRS